MNDNEIPPLTPDRERFNSHVNVTPTCHYWTALLDDDGYGIFTVKGQRVFAHRWIYIDSMTPDELASTDLASLEVDHLCHRRSCVNRQHLELVSHDENQRRRIDRLVTVNASTASVNGSLASVTPDSDNAPRRVVGRPFQPGNKFGRGRPRKGESLPELLRRRIEQPKVKEAVVDATVNRLLREDAVGNRAFADVRDTVYGLPKQTLVLEHGEAPADALDAVLAAMMQANITVDGTAKLLPAGDITPDAQG